MVFYQRFGGWSMEEENRTSSGLRLWLGSEMKVPIVVSSQ